MNSDVVVVEEFQQPVDVVWRALTEREALASWLMKNDFEAQVGAKFRMECPPLPGVRGWVEAEVLELEPPRHMCWSWAVRDGELASIVDFELEGTVTGTRLTIRHSRVTTASDVPRFSSGWRERLVELHRLLEEE